MDFLLQYSSLFFAIFADYLFVFSKLLGYCKVPISISLGRWTDGRKDRPIGLAIWLHDSPTSWRCTLTAVDWMVFSFSIAVRIIFMYQDALAVVIQMQLFIMPTHWMLKLSVKLIEHSDRLDSTASNLLTFFHTNCPRTILKLFQHCVQKMWVEQ